MPESSAARHHRLSDAHAEAWIASHNRIPTRDKVSSALRVLDDAIAQWEPETVYALFSGGGDSIVAAHIASRHPRFNGCVFIDTGTALPGVREHVDAICEREGWKLWVARSSESYEDMIREHGLPGPERERRWCIVKPIPEIPRDQENARLEPLASGPGFNAVTVRVDPVEPVPAGTLIAFAFRVIGYDPDCDGSLMARLEHIDFDGRATGWEPNMLGLYPDDAVVLEDPAELRRLAK